MVFRNRNDAGQKLGEALVDYKDLLPVVFAIPRGGVEIGAEVAKFLDAPLELLIAGKIGHPLDAEVAIGAVTETGEPVWGEEAARITNEAWRAHQVELARAEARRRRLKYTSEAPDLGLRGRTAILVDDGAATGLTMVAALRDLIGRNPESVIAGLPVASAEAALQCANYADKVVALYIPETGFGGVANYYQEFDQVGDEAVRGLLGTYSSARASDPLDLAALNSVLASVSRYPVSSGVMAMAAKRLHAPDNVVSFFETIPQETVFENKRDVMQRAQASETIIEGEAGEPGEQLRSYDL